MVEFAAVPRLQYFDNHTFIFVLHSTALNLFCMLNFFISAAGQLPSPCEIKNKKESSLVLNLWIKQV
jgi:hypothetical protein